MQSIIYKHHPFLLSHQFIPVNPSLSITYKLHFFTPLFSQIFLKFSSNFLKKLATFFPPSPLCSSKLFNFNNLEA